MACRPVSAERPPAPATRLLSPRQPCCLTPCGALGVSVGVSVVLLDRYVRFVMSRFVRVRFACVRMFFFPDVRGAGRCRRKVCTLSRGKWKLPCAASRPTTSRSLSTCHPISKCRPGNSCCVPSRTRTQRHTSHSDKTYRRDHQSNNRSKPSSLAAGLDVLSRHVH